MSTLRLQQRGTHVGRLLIDAERRFNEALVSALHQRGHDDIRPAHGAVFANVDAAGTRVTELARRAAMTKQSMGELVADLEAKGYVERRPDPRDGRARVVVLTERGRAVDRDADAVIEAIEAVYRRTLGEERLAQLRGALEELARIDARVGRG